MKVFLMLHALAATNATITGLTKLAMKLMHHIASEFDKGGSC